jgi:hypothetical protein
MRWPTSSGLKMLGRCLELRSDSIGCCVTRERGDYVPAIRFAREHLRAGHQEEALKWLTQACEERNIYSLMIASDPFYDPLRADRHFVKLLRRMKLDS